MMRRAVHTMIRVALVAALIVPATSPPCMAKVFLSLDEAIGLAFPGEATPARKTAYLTQQQIDLVRELSGEELPVKVVTYYAAAGEERSARTAWFDTHLVRTMPGTVMVVISPAGVVERVDILSFDEPVEYLPRPAWTGQFAGRRLDAGLSTRKDIHPISGATLTARAIVSATRRVLALHAILVAAEDARK